MMKIGISLQTWKMLRSAFSPYRIHLGDMKAAMRVSIGFAFVSILLVIGMALGLGRMAQIKGNLDDISINNLQSKLASEMYLAVAERALAMRNLILLEDAREIQLEIKRIKDQTAKYAAAEEKLKLMFASSPNTTFKEKALLEQIRETSIAAAPYIDTATALALAKRREDAYQLLRFEFRPTQKKWWSLLRELIEFEEERNKTAAIEADHAYSYARTLMLAFGGIALLLTAAAAYMITQAEKRLQSSEQAFRTLVENSPDAIVRYDRDFRRVLTNPAYCRETNISLEVVQNKRLDEVWCKSNVSAEEYKATLRQVMESGVSRNVHLERETPDGKLVNYAILVVAEHNPAGQIVGALAIGRNINDLKEAERQLKQSHAQLHALSVHREVVQEEERKNIARELHDELGQILTALHMSISVLRLKFGKDNAALMEHIQSLTKMADMMMQALKRMVSSLRPPALDMGIASALEWLVDEFSKHSGIACKLQVDEKEITFDETRAIAIFRIVQESLTNVARHAQASIVEITLNRHKTQYSLEVRDNGKGFDPDIRKPKSFGLAGMRERVLALGGVLAVSSTAGHGTVLGVHFPIDDTSLYP